mgnify:CR=1 FL=1
MRAMLETMPRSLALFVALSSLLAVGQETPDIPSGEEPAPEQVIIVPPQPQAEPEPLAEPQPQTEQIIEVPTPDAPPAPETRTFEAIPQYTPPEELDEVPAQLPGPTGPSAMVDGHPREGAFLSGPGSGIFLAHHTLMLGLGGLATQLVPRLIDASPPHRVPGQPEGSLGGGCSPADGVVRLPYSAFPVDERPASCSDIATGPQARVAYLTSTLLGAGIGFASASIWQFFNWVSVRSANFGIINSAFGSMFMGGMVDLITGHNDAYATAWGSLLGGMAGGWLSAILARGDFALNKMFLITSGGAWAAIYGALIVGIVATTGGMSSARTGLDAVMLLPALGAGVAALAALKLNPSIGQIMRANLFGALVGGVVLVVSGLLLGPTTGFTQSPVPYILAGVGALGTQTLVSLLWADAAADQGGSAASDKKTLVWW